MRKHLRKCGKTRNLIVPPLSVYLLAGKGLREAERPRMARRGLKLGRKGNVAIVVRFNTAYQGVFVEMDYQNRLANGWFSWQEGYGAFSYISTRSFRAPYHTISDVTLVGGGARNPDAAFRKGHRAYSSINPVISSAVKQMRMAAGPRVFFDFSSSGAD